MNSAILLDRDGTIIIDKNYLNDPNGVEFLPGAIEGLKEMANKGYLLIVVTNQSGVARGIVQEENVHLIHKKMDETFSKNGIKIAAYYYCPAAADSNHPDRKPNPGMLLKAIKDFNLDPAKCWMIGDRQADVEAGRGAHVKTIFVNNEAHTQKGILPVHFVANLAEASKLV